jgi:hypothetical protein
MEGGECLAVVRQEFGTLNELVDIFFDLSRCCRIPAGSVVLISSLSHLVDVGLDAYAADLNNAIMRLDRVFSGGLIVLPGLFFPPAKVECGMTIRLLANILSWSAVVARVTAGGDPVIFQGFTDLRDLIINLGTGDEQARYGTRHRLPDTLGQNKFKKWHSNGYSGLKAKLEPLDAESILRILNISMAELAMSLGLRYSRLESLGGNQITRFNRNVVFVGASHAKRLASSFKALGAKVTIIDTPGWRSTPPAVAELQVKIRDAVKAMADPLIIFNVLDNSYYQAAGPDGTVAHLNKGNDGRYHVEGDLLCGPAEAAKRSFLQFSPLLRSLADLDKIFVVPLPRYLWSPCCDDAEHGQNVLEPGYTEAQLSDLDACHRLWKGLAHREKFRNLMICNAGRPLNNSLMWGSDPVHPLEEAYLGVAKYLMAGAVDLEGKRKSMLEDPEASVEAKRPRAADISTPPPRFRPHWISSSGQFVTPGQPRPFFRGRGQFRGRGAQFTSQFY